ncbi:MAG: homoserine kinase [Chloroflexi bacterium]|nr:homoserine kinase [Chloroflexota bacterium]MDA1002792.1 homoserine kinase [Chloroflexota bacterium]
MSQRSASVRVPATSANLGPGFDSLGVALDWTADVTVTIADTPLPPPDGPIAGMAASAAAALYRFAGIELPGGLTASVETDMPVGRGLGTSATARVAGVLAADALLGAGHTPDELLPIATRLEGHGDNAVPAMFGGLCVVVNDEDELVHLSLTPPDDLRLALLIPEFSMPTHESRERLPDRLTRNQAVHNIGRAAMLVAAISEHRYDLLRTATGDVLHQPARAGLFPAMYQIFQAARDAGAFGVYLSGGGSTIAAFVDDAHAEDALGAMREAAAAHGLDAATRVCHLTATGAQLLNGAESGS